jgi:transcriptional regulator with XRE-family HTH domain
MQFGEKLRLLRKRHGVTQQQLAEHFSYNKSYIGALEHGRTKPSLTLAIAVARYFGVSVDMLIRDERELEE